MYFLFPVLVDFVVLDHRGVYHCHALSSICQREESTRRIYFIRDSDILRAKLSVELCRAARGQEGPEHGSIATI